MSFSQEIIQGVSAAANITNVFALGGVAAVALAFVIKAAINRTTDLVKAAKSETNLEALKELIRRNKFLPSIKEIDVGNLARAQKHEYLMKLVTLEQEKLRAKINIFRWLSAIATVFVCLAVISFFFTKPSFNPEEIKLDDIQNQIYNDSVQLRQANEDSPTNQKSIYGTVSASSNKRIDAIKSVNFDKLRDSYKVRLYEWEGVAYYTRAFTTPQTRIADSDQAITDEEQALTLYENINTKSNQHDSKAYDVIQWFDEHLDKDNIEYNLALALAINVYSKIKAGLNTEYSAKDAYECYKNVGQNYLQRWSIHPEKDEYLGWAIRIALKRRPA
jgi:hypothetical protein